jgi:hypothetical protein
MATIRSRSSAATSPSAQATQTAPRDVRSVGAMKMPDVVAVSEPSFFVLPLKTT